MLVPMENAHMLRGVKPDLSPPVWLSFCSFGDMPVLVLFMPADPLPACK